MQERVDPPVGPAPGDRPPSALGPGPVAPRATGDARGRSPIDDCVHCGFCLPTCPTYGSWSLEMDSPRGRIDLLRNLRDGKVAWTPTAVEHFDRCLGCMACVTSCPSGVRYDVLIEEARALAEANVPRRLGDRLHRRLIFALFPHPRRMRWVVAALLLYTWTGLRWLARATGLLRLFPALGRLETLLPPLGWRQLAGRIPARVPARGERRARVGLVLGCVQRVFFPGVNDATVRVLAAEGCEVIVPPGQGCCGALSMHAGRAEEGRRLARELVARFEGEALDAVLVNAAGCGSHLKDVGRLLADDPAWAARASAFAAKVRDVTEYLAKLPPRAERRPIHARVAYHSPCHVGHAQGLRAEPRALLRGIPGIELVDVPDAEACCGSAGIYNLVEPEASDEIGRRKVENVLSIRPELLASGNPGCTLQIQRLLRQRGLELRAAHPIEILDASIRGKTP